MFSDNQFTRSYVNKIAEEYLHTYPDINISDKISKLFATNLSVISRKNSFGHITASAIVLDQTFSKVLLIKHKNLGKFIQPGGHVDESDASFYEAAKRETVEETGYNDFEYIQVFEKDDVPIDIDIHIIPDNPKKDEVEHLHFDFRYLFVLKSDNQKEVSEEEIYGYDFVPIENLFKKDESLSRVAKKVYKLYFL